MTDATTVFSSSKDSATAGKEIGSRLRASLGVPDAVVVFASSSYNYEKLLKSLSAEIGSAVVVGCSSAGEFTSDSRGEGSVSALGLKSDEFQFAGGLGTGLSESPEAAARQVLSSFKGIKEHRYEYRTALVLNDALAGYGDELVEQLTTQSGGQYNLVGGGAGDDALFKSTHVFFGDQAFGNAVVALEILSNKPIGIGVRHGWHPASKPMRVTDSVGTSLVSLDAIPAAEVFEEHAAQTSQRLDRKDPIPFFLHNVLGIHTAEGYKLRVPLGINEAGAVACAAEVPGGSAVSIMTTDTASASSAAADATKDAMAQLQGHKPKAAFFFDCVATRLRIGQNFDSEISAVKEVLGNVPMVGCNTYGQVARTEGQFSGFHNCTAVVCVLPE